MLLLFIFCIWLIFLLCVRFLIKCKGRGSGYTHTADTRKKRDRKTDALWLQCIEEKLCFNVRVQYAPVFVSAALLKVTFLF